MFSQVSVILSTGGGGVWQTPPWADTALDRHPPPDIPGAETPPAQCMLGYTHPCPVHAGIHAPPLFAATAADGTHPTGMHSCFTGCNEGSVHILCDSGEPVWLPPVVSATLRAWRSDASGFHPVSVASVNKQ